VKCSVVERAHRPIRNRLYKYFTYKNTYRYIDVLPKYVKAYNDTVHSTSGMEPSKVSDSYTLALWKRMEEKRCSIRTIRARFRVGQHVRISKEKMKFGKGAEQNYSREIFRVVKVIERWPRGRLRVGRFKSNAYRRPDLPRGIDSRPRHEKYSLQDR